MRAVVQRVSRAEVRIGGNSRGNIGPGLLVYVGVGPDDSEEDALWLVRKIVPLRVFPDDTGKLSLALPDTGGGILVISQFTLFGTLAKGARPSFHRAARPEQAIPLYERFLTLCSETLGKPVAAGEFGADMAVDYINDGPVTIWLDSKNRDY